jgi:hypothetical protein
MRGIAERSQVADWLGPPSTMLGRGYLVQRHPSRNAPGVRTIRSSLRAYLATATAQSNAQQAARIRFQFLAEEQSPA